MFKEIQTERLWLKNICYEDIEFIFEQFSNDDINRYLYDAEPMKELSEAQELIDFYTVSELKSQHRWIIGWDFPNISQEQSNVFHMHGYSAALVLDKDQEIGDIDADVVTQEKQKYITITIRGTSEAPFVVIPNAYKALLTHMKTNGIREKRDSSTLTCYEYEYVDDTGINCMDIFIAIEQK